MQADILEVQAGQSTWSKAAKRRGGDLESNLRQKAEDIKLIQEIATEYGVDEEELLKAQIPGQTRETITEQAEPPKPEQMPEPAKKE
jgi:capsid protein